MNDAIEQRKIAIIHREGNLIEVLARVIQSLNYSTSTMVVNCRTQPQQVVDFVGQETPDLVLLAENFSPKKTGKGIEALAQVNQAYPETPVYMVSGGMLHEEEAMQNGAAGYIPMPAGKEELEEFLRHAL